MVYWRHYSPSVTQTAFEALASARTGTFATLPQEERVRQLRVLLLLSLQAATLSDMEGPLGILAPAMFEGNHERTAISSALARTSMLLMAPGKVKASQDVMTFDAEPAIFGDIPMFPDPIGVSALPALAVVAIVTAAAAAACYVATVITQSQHAIAFEEEKTKRLLGTQATSIAVVAQHIDRERLFGKVLPFEEEERSILKNLETTQREIAAEKHVPLPTPFDGARDFGLALAETTREVGKSTAEAVSWVVPVAIGAGFLWLTRK